MLVLKKGRIKVSRFSNRGKELILHLVESGEVIGEMSLYGAKPRRRFAEALQDSLLAMLPGTVLEGCFARRPELLRHLWDLMTHRYNGLEDRLLDLAFGSASTRLARLLRRLSLQYGVRDRRGILVSTRFSQATLGSLTGSSREAVNVTLGRFREEGVVSVDDRRLIIRQWDALERFDA